MSSRTNLALNIGTLAALLIALIIGGALAADIYTIVEKAVKQSQENSNQLAKTAQKLNSSYDQILDAQQDANDRGNITINYFEQLFNKMIDAEDNIIGNLTDHRRIANISRDTQIDLLKQILNQTK